jgi:hypothetical protein
MRCPCGPPRKLSGRQIREVLKWHDEADKFRRRHGTVRDLAALLNVSSHVIRRIVEPSGSRGARGIGSLQRESRPGRPRHLSAVKIAFVIEWCSAGREFRIRHGSLAMLALKMDVSASTIHDCIRRRGRYMQLAHVGLCTMSKSGRTRRYRSDEALRSELLRGWRRT